MRAVGFTCGIGSMLVGARDAGFEVVGNIEWRRYYHSGTFTRNFDGAWMVNGMDDVSDEETARLLGIDLAMGHPECGNFSNLRVDKTGALDDPADIPLYLDMVARYKPRFFVMDDLPKSFIALPMEAYHDRLPEYDLFPEWISNYHYGNCQKQRKRMFMVGSLRSEAWTFRSGERPTNLTLKDVIGDLCERWQAAPNHHEHVGGRTHAGRARHLLGRDEAGTWGDIQAYFREKKSGHIMEYHSPDGGKNVRFGLAKAHWDDGGSHVLTGTNPLIHPITCLPLSIRERARIQGFPDDFVFVGENVTDDGQWNHDANNALVKQTGKAMPVQFCRYVARSIAAHLRGEAFEDATDERYIPANEYIDRAKRWYCHEVGYTNQEAACSACWMRHHCDIRRGKYSIRMPGDPSLEAVEWSPSGSAEPALEPSPVVGATPGGDTTPPPSRRPRPPRATRAPRPVREPRPRPDYGPPPPFRGGTKNF